MKHFERTLYPHPLPLSYYFFSISSSTIFPPLFFSLFLVWIFTAYTNFQLTKHFESAIYPHPLPLSYSFFYLSSSTFSLSLSLTLCLIPLVGSCHDLRHRQRACNKLSQVASRSLFIAICGVVQRTRDLGGLY